MDVLTLRSQDHRKHLLKYLCYYLVTSKVLELVRSVEDLALYMEPPNQSEQKSMVFVMNLHKSDCS